MVGYQPLNAVPEEEDEIDIEQNPVDTEEDSVIIRGDILRIRHFTKYHTGGKEAHYKHINQIVNQLTTNLNIT